MIVSSGMYIEVGYGRVFRYVYRRYWLCRVFRYVYRRYIEGTGGYVYRRYWL